MRILTSSPALVREAEIVQITAQISGAWLLMITMIGSLPADAARALSAEEQRAFYDWGRHIQRMDALADLEKDLADGHRCSEPMWRLTQRARPARDARAVYAQLAAHDVDIALMPSASALDQLEQQLGALGEVGPLLRWIWSFLQGRYLAHRWCARTARTVG